MTDDCVPPAWMVVRDSYRSLKRFGMGTRFGTVRFVGDADEVDEAWREYRATGLGGSDIAAIMGISPFRTALDVWLEKTGRQATEDISNVEAVYWGTVNEAAVADRWARDHPDCKVRRLNATLIGRPEWKRANLDRMVIGPDGRPSVLEIKTASAFKADEWDGGVPPYYLTQVTWYLAITGWDMAHVAVLIGGNDYREFDVPRDEEDIRAVTDAATDFWENYVVKDVMPEVVGADVDALASLHRSPSDDYATPDDLAQADRLIRQYTDASYDEKDASRRKRDVQAKLCQLIGDAKGIETDVARVTWNRSERKRFDSKRFREENPDLYDEYQTTSQYSQLKVKEI